MICSVQAVPKFVQLDSHTITGYFAAWLQAQKLARACYPPARLTGSYDWPPISCPTLCKGKLRPFFVTSTRSTIHNIGMHSIS